MGNKRMCMTEYLVYKYKKDGPKVVNSPQGGGDPDEFNRAKEAFNAARDDLTESIRLKDELSEAQKKLEKQEAEYNDKISKLEKKVSDKRLSATKIGTAKMQLEELKGQDPLPLRKAKLTTKAALKKSKQATKKAQKAFEGTKELFDNLKKQGGAANGAIWWMQRE